MAHVKANKKKPQKKNKKANVTNSKGVCVKQPAEKNPLFSVYAVVAIIIAGIICYSNTLHNPFIFDDIPNIVEKSAVHLDSFTFEGIKKAFYGNRPVTMLSFALNYYWGKLDPFGYHIINIIIHVLCAVFVYLFVKVTLELPSLKEYFAGQSGKVALLTGLLFVAHPVQTQAVTYIVQRLASLATLWYVIVCYCYVKARLSTGNKQFFLLGVCVVGLFMALASKETSMTIPVFLALYEYYFFRKFKLEPHQKKKFYILFAVAVFFAVFVGLYYTNFQPFEWLDEVYKKYHFTPGQRMLTQLRVVVYYVSLMFVPLPSRLSLDYDFTLSYSLLNPPSTLLAFIFVIFMIVGSIWIAKKRPLVSFAIIWFWGNLVLESSFLPIELIYEHRLYLPSLGFCLLISVLLVKGMDRLSANADMRNTVLGVVVLVLIMPLGIMTYQRNSVWQDRAVLWADSVEKTPTKARPHYNLANVYAQRQQYDTAIPYYLKAIELKPNHAKAHNNLGYCYFFKGDIQGAIKKSQTALKYNPKLVDAYFNIGTYYANLGRLPQAIEEFKKALKINPKYTKAIIALRELEKELKQRG